MPTLKCMAKLDFSPSSPPIATVGYEKTNFSDFLRSLQRAGIQHILDIRELPLSRRFGFSKTPLSASLSQAGIAYSHLRGLGTPRAGRQAAHAGRRQEFQDIFADHMKTDIAQTTLLQAADMVKAERCCLLCFEAEASQCHRAVVAAALHQLTGLDVLHLQVSGL